MKRLKLIAGSQSQAGQESFVLNHLEFKKCGYYMEVGAYHSKIISNTYILENKYEWKGLSLEIDKSLSIEFKKNRKNPILTCDATEIDFDSIFKYYTTPNVIDYLQIDIEPAGHSFKVLKSFLKTKIQASVITFEHDRYAARFNFVFKHLAYLLLLMHGYKRVANDICHNKRPFEDWYVKDVNPDFPKIRKQSEGTKLFHELDNQ
jgi:hypothetical protein